ncbi:uncharacterized protein CC84DRAFT_1007125 [Paraphaeosphaeria sporulosa]|uniref:Uncharacterized protein n=1 Tax=Paraphaeosphaeria sporulosa TaxID=1460663 RepID=A0A177C3Z6_9PLEO|nr:uncharacterized protein CC84DRAFT_1007125 [Paraphaeosphaeria sporulosa]OAG02215.1 hypothetical protein CC84DRAFT_1007125 [Paraphaeosphaeria sporulosa]
MAREVGKQRSKHSFKPLLGVEGSRLRVSDMARPYTRPAMKFATHLKHFFPPDTDCSKQFPSSIQFVK